MGLFNQRKITDERVINLQNKIYGEIFKLITVIIGISILVKSFYLGIHVKHLLTEMIILLLSSGYYVFRSVQLGIFSDEVEIHDRTNKIPKMMKNSYLSIALGIAISIVMGFNSAISYGEGGWDSVYTFLLVFAVTFIFYIPVLIIIFVIGHEVAKRRSQQVLAKQLEKLDGDDDEKH